MIIFRLQVQKHIFITVVLTYELYIKMYFKLKGKFDNNAKGDMCAQV